MKIARPSFFFTQEVSQKRTNGFPIVFPEGLMKLTPDTVRRLSLPAGKSEMIIFDDEISGFGIRLRDGGSCNWIVQYKLGRKHRRMTIGSIKLLSANKARETAKDLLARVRLGLDPAGERQNARAQVTDTLGVLIDKFLRWQQARLKARSFVEVERYLKHAWKPLHERAMSTLDRAAVSATLSIIKAHHGAISAERARSALSKCFKWAIGEGLADQNPVIGTNKQAETVARDRVLSPAEVKEIWNALPADQYGAIVKLLILTGQRREEIAALRWSEIDMEACQMTFSPQRTKNKRRHVVPLSGPATAILEGQVRRADRDLVFGNGEGGFSGWSKAKRALDAKLEHVDPWRLHDLRRTVSTVMAESSDDPERQSIGWRGLSVFPHVVEAVLNHVSGHKAGVAGVYNRASYAPEKRNALNLWAAHLMNVVGADHKVVPQFANQNADHFTEIDDFDIGPEPAAKSHFSPI
jgi:integrase